MIRIALYQGVSVISRAIRWQTRSVYSHAAVVFDFDIQMTAPPQYGRAKIVNIHAGNVIEAWRGGVRLSASLSANHTPKTRVDLFTFKEPLKQSEALAITHFLVSQLGKPYDYVSILRFLTRTRDNEFDCDRWFCSELAFQAFAVGGRRLLARTPAWKVPPAWIAMSTLIKPDSSILT